MGSATVLSADTLAGGRGPSRCPFTPTQPRLLPRPRRSTPSPLWGHAGLETGLLWLPGLSSPGSISPLDRASTKIEAKLCSGRCHLWASQLPSSSAPAHAPFQGTPKHYRHPKDDLPAWAACSRNPLVPPDTWARTSHFRTQGEFLQVTELRSQRDAHFWPRSHSPAP